MTPCGPPAPCPSVALVPGAGCTKAPPAALGPPPPARAVPFADGPHGIDPEVDADLVGRLTQIYGP